MAESIGSVRGAKKNVGRVRVKFFPFPIFPIEKRVKLKKNVENGGNDVNLKQPVVLKYKCKYIPE